ncbi:hypothetical protein GA0116948_1321 [Chitinophaga costaii]|uniref:Uncharacterized protein n=1 Tax=Chitinophaga costaii TaxID=1335309 RepID=A0A1C4G8H6_9BACT|nr:hypothetical protein [Chitinophaga costaii]PUZ19478.1 hypothetical protein DCM91_20475 [Chitinophaga costaii]SCC64444.1 hypothetical protein GA0116948_1321 [Chitinophaga costaii]
MANASLYSSSNLKLSQDDLDKKLVTLELIIGRYDRREIKPAIEMAKKIADEQEVIVDYLDSGPEIWCSIKNLLKRMENIEALPPKEK